MPTSADVRAQINAAINSVGAELGRAATQDAKTKLKQSMKDLIRLRAQVARGEIQSNSEALRQLKQALNAAVTRARESQLSTAVGRLGEIVDAVSGIIGGTATPPSTTPATTPPVTPPVTPPATPPEDDRLAPPPEIEGLPPPVADTPGDADTAVSPEEYWYADEREDLVAVKTETLTEPPPPSDPTDAPQWPVDGWSPDYGHLGLPHSAAAFRFAAADLALLCRLNAFDVTFGQDEVLFGLRGCTIAGGTGGRLRDEVMLQEAKPNHRDFRCVIGVWKRSTSQVAVFTASTVPNPTGMRRQFALGEGERRCNLLPTGRYKYVVGNHKAVPNAFRLEQEVVVLRSHDDLMFETTDVWDRCTPGDNIHPAWSSSEAQFSSFGCQTVNGTHNAATGHTGEWAAFRAAAGLSPAGNERTGQTYVYILLTGREAHYARFLNDAGKADDPVSTAAIRRLRFGSGTNGDAALKAPVLTLQQKLDLAGPDGAFGPTTAMAVVAWQKKSRGFADGILTPVLASDLGIAMGPAAEGVTVADPSALGPLTRGSAEPLPPAPGVVTASGDRIDPNALQISEKAVFSFMLGNESFYAYQYFMLEGDTIGYGHLIQGDDARFVDGLTEDEAFALFQEDMGFFVGVIRRSIDVPITQGQFDALASLTANVGHVPSAVKALINAGDFAAAGEQFKRYVKDLTGRVLPGLVRRREMESHLFLTGSYPKASLSGGQVLSREVLRDRHLRQIEKLFPDRLGEPHGSVTRELQRRQARSAYQRMTGRALG